MIRRFFGAQSGEFRIVLRQTGGFAGLTREVKLDSRRLPDVETKTLAGLIRNSGVFSVEIKAAKPFPDGLNYELFVESGAGKKSLSFHTGNCPKELMPLIDFLNERSSYS